MIIKGWRAKLYPNSKMTAHLGRLCDHARGAWNLFIRLEDQQYKKDKTFIWYKQLKSMLPELKKQPETAWVSELPTHSVQQITKEFCGTLRRAMMNKKKGATLGFPKFKKKRYGVGSFYLANSTVHFNNTHIRIPKIGSIRFRGPLIAGKLLNARVMREGDGFIISCQFECADEIYPQAEVARIGIDLGVKNLVTVFDGATTEIIETPKFYRKAEKKLKRNQRRLSRKKKGSNRQKAQIKKNAAFERKVKNKRKNFTHQLTHRLTTKAGEIKVETLNVKGMVKNHHLAKSVSDASMGMIIRQLEYKSAWRQRKFIKVDRWFPSSQLCSSCGFQNKQMKNLVKRTLHCSNCSMIIDRDANAAINIYWYGKESRNRDCEISTGVKIGDQGAAMSLVPIKEASIVSHLANCGGLSNA